MHLRERGIQISFSNWKGKSIFSYLPRTICVHSCWVVTREVIVLSRHSKINPEISRSRRRFTRKALKRLLAPTNNLLNRQNKHVQLTDSNIGIRSKLIDSGHRR